MEKKELMVSISCITYNQAPYIRECLDGFVMQKTDFSFEVLIHDDCSTDGTTEIIKEYERKYPEIINPIYEEINQYQNGKPAGSFVWNFPRAKGKYIAMCEGDDYWSDPLRLQKQVDFLESHPDYMLTYGKVRQFIQRTGKSGSTFGYPVESAASLLKRNVIPTPSTLFRADMISSYMEDVRPYEKHWLMGDFPLWLYCAIKGKVNFADEILATYRVLGESASHSENIEKKIKFEDSYFAIQKWYNDTYHLVDMSELENVHKIRCFDIAIMLNRRREAIRFFNDISNPSLKDRLKYFIVKAHLTPIFKLRSQLRGLK